MIGCPNKGPISGRSPTRPRGRTLKPQNALSYGTLVGSLVALMLCMLLTAVISRAWARMSIPDRGDVVIAGLSEIETSFLLAVRPGR